MHSAGVMCHYKRYIFPRHIIMACIVMACIVMVCIVMTYLAMACIVMAYIVMADIVMGCILMAATGHRCCRALVPPCLSVAASAGPRHVSAPPRPPHEACERAHNN